jgi:hypothetical protein
MGAFMQFFTNWKYHTSLALGMFMSGSVVADGPFLFLPEYLPTEESISPTMIATGDADDDGDIDILLPGRNNDGFAYLLLNDGEGNFDSQIQFVTEKQCDHAEIIDLDGDGVTDICFALRSSYGRIMIFWGMAEGGFEKKPQYIRLSRQPRGLAIRDYDQDGQLDIAAINYDSGELQVIRNEGSRVFSMTASLQLGRAITGIPSLQKMQAGDLDGDGDIDLAVISTGHGRVYLFRNRGDGSFEIPDAWMAPKVDEEFPGITDLVLGDIDSDGDEDLLVPMIFIDSVGHVGIMRNDGDMTIQRRDAEPATDIGYAFSIAAADLDSDGDLDPIMGCAIPGKITILDNRTVPLSSGGDGTLAFESFQSIANETFIRAITCFDIDQDCDQDILAVDLISSNLMIFRNFTPQANGCGDPPPDGFAPMVMRKEAEDFRPLDVLVDVNGDGRMNAIDLALMLGLHGGARP